MAKKKFQFVHTIVFINGEPEYVASFKGEPPRYNIPIDFTIPKKFDIEVRVFDKNNPLPGTDDEDQATRFGYAGIDISRAKIKMTSEQTRA
jgi:hypothetical protein